MRHSSYQGQKVRLDLSIEVAKKIAEKGTRLKGAWRITSQTITVATGGEVKLSRFGRKYFEQNTTEEKNFFHPDEVIKNICAFYGIKETWSKDQKETLIL